MITRYKIKENGVEVLDLSESEAFRLGADSFPGNWLKSGGAIPAGYTVEAYDATPAPPPPPTRWQVPYVTMLDRMSDANADVVAGFIEGMNAKQRERIRREGVWSDNQVVRGRLTQAGEDPDIVLAQ